MYKNTLVIQFKICLLFLLILNSTFAKCQALQLEIDPELSLNYNSFITFQVTLTDGELIKKTYSKKRKNRLHWSDLDIKIKGGQYLKKGIMKIHSGEKLNEKGNIEIKISYNDMVLTKVIQLTFDQIQIVDFNGKHAKKRRSNDFLRALPRLFANHLITEATGVEIETKQNPNRGLKGKKGSHAGHIIVDLDTVHINKQIILKAVCEDQINHKVATAYINPQLTQLKIMAEGGDGSAGTYGGDGIGGDGGQAGSGGTVEVLTNKATSPFIHSLIVSTAGGFGGFRGASSTRHNPSKDGLNGNYGQVVFISK